MSDINYTELADLVYRSQHYPSHLLVTTNAKTADTGTWVKVVDKYATTAMIETVMRLGVEKGEPPIQSVYMSKPMTHVYADQNDEFITPEQELELMENGLVDAGIGQFLAYMKVNQVDKIKAVDFKKAQNALETIKKGKK